MPEYVFLDTNGIERTIKLSERQLKKSFIDVVKDASFGNYKIEHEAINYGIKFPGGAEEKNNIYYTAHTPLNTWLCLPREDSVGQLVTEAEFEFINLETNKVIIKRIPFRSLNFSIYDSLRNEFKDSRIFLSNGQEIDSTFSDLALIKGPLTVKSLEEENILKRNFLITFSAFDLFKLAFIALILKGVDTSKSSEVPLDGTINLICFLLIGISLNLILEKRSGQVIATPTKSSTLPSNVKKTQKRIKEVVSSENINNVALYQLEQHLGYDFEKAVEVRRSLLSERSSKTCLQQIPYKNFDYEKIFQKNCENVIGFVPIPVGIAGPVKVNSVNYYIPLATTEGALVASTSRGCKALSMGDGVIVKVTNVGMTRAPVVEMSSIQSATDLKEWINENIEQISDIFDSSSEYLKLKEIRIQSVGRILYLRFRANTGEAMGMNMTSKGTEMALKYIKSKFPEMKIISLSGNYCCDKKTSAINWIEGRGKSVNAEAVIKGNVLKSVLKVTTEDIIKTNNIKNLLGSAMAGSLGGFNAQSANIIAAMFIALGQDPAQSVSSSFSITFLDSDSVNPNDLRISLVMPSLECGVVGGGTGLAAQKACISMLVDPEDIDSEGSGSCKLAAIIAATVMAAELSLLASLTEGTLVQAHSKLNHH